MAELMLVSTDGSRVAPDGYHFEWVADADWRLSNEGKRCRMIEKRVRCGGAAVAALQRGSRTGPHWWHYCAEHLYGRRIANGRVEVLILVDTSPAAPDDSGLGPRTE